MIAFQNSANIPLVGPCIPGMHVVGSVRLQPAMGAEWLRRCAAEAKDITSVVPAPVAACQMEAESTNTRVEISVHVNGNFEGEIIGD